MEIHDVMFTLQQFIRRQFKVTENDADFNDDVHLFDYGYIDSFGAVDLVAFTEKTFEIEMKDSDLIAYPLNTIREIATFVMKRKKGEL